MLDGSEQKEEKTTRKKAGLRSQHDKPSPVQHSRIKANSRQRQDSPFDDFIPPNLLPLFWQRYAQSAVPNVRDFIRKNNNLFMDKKQTKTVAQHYIKATVAFCGPSAPTPSLKSVQQSLKSMLPQKSQQPNDKHLCSTLELLAKIPLEQGNTLLTTLLTAYKVAFCHPFDHRTCTPQRFIGLGTLFIALKIQPALQHLIDTLNTPSTSPKATTAHTALLALAFAHQSAQILLNQQARSGQQLLSSSRLALPLKKKTKKVSHKMTH